MPRRFAAAPGDSRELRSEKDAILLVAVSCCVAGVIWTLVYALAFGWVLATFLPAVFVVVVGSALVTAHMIREHRIAIHTQIAAIAIIPALLQWSIGGIADSGVVILWAFLGPVAALMFLTLRQAIPWYGFFVATVVITVVGDPWFSERALEVGDTTRRLFFAMNLGAASLVVFAFAGHVVLAEVRERRRANELLLNVLPASVAETLKDRNGTIAEYHPQVSVLFADITGSTPLFTHLEPAEVVEWLNEVFSALDEVVARHDLEKLRTMGDNYMVGSGVPTPRPDHAVALVRCAIDMADAVDAVPARHGDRIAMRFGIHSGPVVAGVIGKSKFHYDLWGDTVNIASRMESSGEPGHIQISAATHALVMDQVTCTARGVIAVKGRGDFETWWVERPD